MISNQQIIFSDEVKEALKCNKPIVALESTIFCHGLPFPQNIQTAIRMENTVRQEGAVPAHIAIIKGKIHVGLSENEIEFLANAPDVHKVSRNDLPVLLVRGLHGATTVATTMFIAALSGIKIFATGGIGGVHRGAESSFDISADLQELARTDVVVVSAGAKAILDIPKTLEYLETHGVPVVGYKTEDFPAFYASKSGLKLNLVMHNAGEIAAFTKTKWLLGLHGAVLVANPVPPEFAMKNEEMELLIGNALVEAEKAGVSGKNLTPFLLKYTNEHSNGKSISTNIELAVNNARLAAQISIAYQSIAG
jgi:pseudouridylate synthase